MAKQIVAYSVASGRSGNQVVSPGIHMNAMLMQGLTHRTSSVNPRVVAIASGIVEIFQTVPVAKSVSNNVAASLASAGVLANANSSKRKSKLHCETTEVKERGASRVGPGKNMDGLSTNEDLIADQF